MQKTIKFSFMVVMDLPISLQCCDDQGAGADAIAKPNEENPMASMPMQDSMAKIP